MNKNLIVILLTLVLAGCREDDQGNIDNDKIIKGTGNKMPLVEEEIGLPSTEASKEDPLVEVPQEVMPPTIETPSTPLEPVITETPVATQPKPQPQAPTLPIFIGEGITTHTQQPYSGTITKGGDAYLRYNQDATTMDKFELPEWTVEYRYQPFLEVLITNGGEALCARYSWKLQGFGYAKPHCLWSDTRQAVPLEDMKAAYYGYSVVEIRVWVSGVVGAEIK